MKIHLADILKLLDDRPPLWIYIFFAVHFTKSELIAGSIPVLTLLIPLSANPTKWSNTLKQFVGNLPTNYLSVFDHFVKLALKG